MASHVRKLLQAKIYDLIQNDADIIALVNSRVYDHVPANPTYPFITMGDVFVQDWGSHTHSGFDVTLVIHTWGQAAGRMSVQEIMNQIYSNLHDADLGITGFNTLSCRESTSRVLVEQDNKTHHGISEYRILLDGN
jgi:hypothetical protein